MMIKLDQEEQEILAAFESGALVSVKNKDQEINKHQTIAALTIKKIEADFLSFSQLPTEPSDKIKPQLHPAYKF